ncbi:ATP synthase subunit gamma, mitochondrial-like [Physella acuta]|uniref:ATP synthase subunit gamma, mitochondrial-like n=1 Tax=Physella acuta TaxID=109671 RepID=UPI0027DD4A99|nr:ATP synthase subunit gamma, mitochondrial-like [Physella acuta]
MEAILSRAAPLLVPQCGQIQTRGMATLKEIRLRLKSVTNIQKITKSMKMVSAAKYAKAERELKPARQYGIGAKAFYQKAEVADEKNKPHQLLVVMSSDRGLCGGIHSSVVKYVKAKIEEGGSGIETKFIVVGDKAKGILQRTLSSNILYSFNDYGKRPPTFSDAALVANMIMNLDYKYDRAALVFNTFKSVISYITTELPLYNPDAVQSAQKFNLYDSIDDEVLRSYNEFSLASLILFAMKEGACSEQSSRMTAMDAASKNAGEMIGKLTLTFNRTRQAVITRELIEIISGAAAL